jgi:hypothetical protein
MSMYVEDLTTEVTPAPEASSTPAPAEGPQPLEPELVRAAIERLARDRARTWAEGFDD